MSLTYLRDFALDLIRVALRHPDKIGQLVADWEVTLEEIEIMSQKSVFAPT
jgi:hypothetical protein